MDIYEAHNAMRNQLTTMVDRPTTVWDNIETPTTFPFLVVEMVPGDARFASLARQQELRGMMQVTVVTGQGIGSLEAERIARRVVQAYPVDLKIDELILAAPPLMVPGYPDGGQWRQPVQIRWRVLPG